MCIFDVQINPVFIAAGMCACCLIVVSCAICVMCVYLYMCVGCVFSSLRAFFHVDGNFHNMYVCMFVYMCVSPLTLSLSIDYV